MTARGQRLSTIDLFDSRLTLLIGPAAGAWRPRRPGFRAEPPYRCWPSGTDVFDPTGTLTERYRLADDGAVLVRPDGYVTWSSETASYDAAATLDAAFAQTLGESVWQAERLVSVA